MGGVKWTSEEVEALRRAYAVPIPNLDHIARVLGRHKTNICRKARELGLTEPSRPKKLQLSLNYTPPMPEAERNARTGARMREYIATQGHPRGMAGKKHCPETLAKVAEASRRMWADQTSKLRSPELTQLRSDLMYRRMATGAMRVGYSRGRMGRRADLDNRHFRSAWEANYARYLNWLKARRLISGWDFECHRFLFEAIKFGTRSYLPDFKVTNIDGSHEWHEVKGWMDQKSKTRLRRMAKYFPNEKVVVISKEFFKQLRAQGITGIIPNWEAM